jgi:hypothetical protein
VGLFDRFRKLRNRRQSSRSERAAFDRQVDAVVEAVDPRLSMAPGYRRRLAPALREAIRVIDAQFATLPPPLEVSRERWSREPFLRAAFTNPDAMQKLFDDHRPLRRFLASAEARGAGTIYAGLGMSLGLDRRFGHALHGDVVQRDVAQTALSLGDHRLSAFATDPAQLAESVRRRVLQDLAARATQAVFGSRMRKEQLGEERVKLQMRLRLYEQEVRGLAGLWHDEEVITRHAQALRDELAATEGELETLSHSAADIDDFLDMTVAVFAGMERDVRLESQELHVDAMNLCHDGPGEGTSALQLTVAHVARRPPRVIRLLSFAPGFVRFDSGDGLRQAARALGVG